MKNYRISRRVTKVSAGEFVKIIRKLQKLTREELAALTGIPRSALSAIENGRIQLGVARAKVLAMALKCHPAVLVFPGWDIKKRSAA